MVSIRGATFQRIRIDCFEYSRPHHRHPARAIHFVPALCAYGRMQVPCQNRRVAVVQRARRLVPQDVAERRAIRFQVGEYVEYFSESTHRRWMPTRVRGVNADGTYKLDVKHAAPARLVRPLTPAGSKEPSRRSCGWASPASGLRHPASVLHAARRARA